MENLKTELMNAVQNVLTETQKAFEQVIDTKIVRRALVMCLNSFRTL